MQVPVKPYYTISSLVLLQEYGQYSVDQSTALNILLDMPPSQFPFLFKLLHSMQNNYLFSLPVSVFNNKDILKALLPACYLLASTDHFCGNAPAIIPVLWNHPVQPAAINTDAVKHYFNEQGIEDLQLPFFEYSYEAGLQETASCSFCVYPAAVKNMTEQVNVAPAIIAFTPEIRDLITFNHCVGQVTTTMDAECLSENYIEKKILENEVQHWRQRTLLYRHFLQLSKTVQEKEYYEVLDWYRKEYEVLPLWYKQFGHIIKVMMGKRSFRSLFSDKVKKYKD